MGGIRVAGQRCMSMPLSAHGRRAAISLPAPFTGPVTAFVCLLSAVGRIGDIHYPCLFINWLELR